MILITLITALLTLLASWQDCFDIGCDRFIDIEDPEDWRGREAEWCEAQMVYASNFADDYNDDDSEDDDSEDDDDCSHPSSTQSSDGAFRCDACNTVTYDISDEEFANQYGGNFSSSDFRGW